MMDINLDKMCRICLKEGDNLKSIFYNDDLPSDKISISVKIMACSSVQVVAGDGLPELICLNCSKDLEVAYQFREKCESADAALRKYIRVMQSWFHSNAKKCMFTKKKEENTSCMLTSEKSFLELGKSNNRLNMDNNSNEPLAIVQKKKKKREKPDDLKGRKQKTSKKCGEGDNGSDSDKKKIKDEKDIKCPICKKTFAYLCILKDHMVQHTGAKPYLCSVCGKSFGHTASLTNHMKTHYSDKPHKCDQCELSFHRRSHLVLHMRTHTGEKPFVCDVCGRDFAQSSYLREHMRVHSGEKPFVCDICGHGFARKSCLVMHRRIHTGELPFACPECGRAFSQRSQRKRHVKRNHKGSACLRATGELILKDLDKKNKNTNTNREEILQESSLNDGSLHENPLTMPSTSGLIQRDNSVGIQQYQDNNQPLLIYQQENVSTMYPSTVVPLPLIQIQTTLLQ